MIMASLNSSFQRLADFFQHFPLPIVILDFETTGGDLYQDRVTEIAFLHFYQGKIHSFSQLIQPQKNIPPFVARLTGINDEMVKNAPLFGEIWPNISPFLKGSLLIAHNSQFDYAFLCHETRRENLAFATHTLCSVKLSRALYPMFHKHNLDSLIERHHLTSESRHRAMSDVLNLAQFLQLALLEYGEEKLQKHILSLIQPAILPHSIHNSLRQDIYQLSDSYGVTLWQNEQGNVLNILTHEKTFTECAQELHHSPTHTQETHSLTFYPAIGVLHAHFIKAKLLHQYQLTPTNQSAGRHTILFTKDCDGCLKARIRELKTGFQATPPTGLFLNSKAAKRALHEWAKTHHICPTQLGILPNELPKNAPCPALLVNGCTESCRQQNSEQHNAKVQAALPFLPNHDCGKQTEQTFTETDWATGKSHTFTANTGALYCDELGWYIEKNAIDALKQKHKKAKHSLKHENTR